MRLKTDDVVLFIGDSITDVGRNRSDEGALGQGYPHLVAAQLLTDQPTKNFQFYNRGIGGDTLDDLVHRWERDCLELNPDVISILIGINDIWEGNIQTQEDLDHFEEQYRYLLKTLYQRTDARVVLMEPYVVPYKKDRHQWRPMLDVIINIIRKLARDYQTDFIPLDGLINAVAMRDGLTYYTEEDGVHPTLAGHGFIAQKWLENLGN
ncbi:SGNH/GDSL hydrolase family protein [Dolosigranulum pigrum]|uniref:SGNH/GDSL hydrolase family protein n=1 Tax=Dolosigranulum pigrum TaxID=29394 RepID=UPI001AD88C8D|nr:SGNH/GDSL hydrolase family protein [Dolosigranulum pigrum]QTJ42877.1 GDSL family lipase [Dolosigranulum pigrum]QTJ46275.1 GDSL family lipase [Dolosigranulum pigrum]